MTRGTKPKPYSQIEHNPHGTRREKLIPPNEVTGDPLMPNNLDSIAQAEWQRITSLLRKLGTLSATDSATLELYCCAYSRYRVAQEEVRKNKPVLTSARGTPYHNPWYSIMHKELEVCKKLLIEFGLTAASRSRISIQVPPDLGDLSQYIQS